MRRSRSRRDGWSRHDEKRGKGAKPVEQLADPDYERRRRLPGALGRKDVLE
jgi:hypothetical protein